jgi:NAD(P)-dependent dehydrogenase (short-subunit alcohol dehydrogenase family)
MSFSGKVVLITGAAGGIGKATAKAFAGEGAKLALVDLTQEDLQRVAKELNVSQNDCLLLPADVTVEEEVKSFVQKTKEFFGTIDVFFNNAGVEGKFAMITDNTAENFEQVLNVKVKGSFYGLKHVLAVMIAQKAGSIINSSSVAGLIGVPGLGPYVASNHAIIGLTKTAALESAASGVRVNAVCPAPINTRMMRSIESGAAPENPEAAKEQFSQLIPFGRYGEPEEVAQVVMFLASEGASFISGGSYTIDGCLTIA